MTEVVAAPLVHVLLATYNGAAHLQEQLDSLRDQVGVRIRLYVSDDGSTDESLAIVRRFEAWPVEILPEQPHGGSTANFLRLLRYVRAGVGAGDFIAFCDQDDIWNADKLKRSVEALQAGDGTQPAGYGARTLLVDPQNRPVGYSRLFRKPPSFANALVQCYMGGNTLVLNAAAAQVVGDEAHLGVPSHDWWSYQAVTACGGRFIYDPLPGVRYRLHAANEVGSNRGLLARIRRLATVLEGDYQCWNAVNTDALLQLGERLVPESRKRLADFQRARSARWPWQRLWFLHRSGVFRQTGIQTLAVWGACLIKRL